MRTSIVRLAALFVAGLAIAASSADLSAQQRWPWSNDKDRNRSQNVAGEFDYYALVLSWSPSYCAEKGDDRDDAQCNRRDGRRYSFVVHGLWPQYEQGWPSSCRLSRRPFVPDSIIDGMLDVMPSRGLIIHEYRTHGTCSGLDPARYFATTRKLFESISIPQRFANPFDSQIVSLSDVRNEFLRANPRFGPDMMSVVCGGSGKALKEVRFCFSKDGQPRNCGQNENQRRQCSTDRVFIPPVRSTARGNPPTPRLQPSQPAPNTNSSPLPGPRMDYDYGRNRL
ncbi:ribonuclease T [Hyphomicrobium methylovorum]|uniref:ribonuclease T2 family protein n=1 Tax=Hyphomicrobium methylovorum TaxID=84 RepID=UPI0015E7BC89|nr:ribonuclease T2 [Hyphomicrobium methylovorum]MBA2127271.1 ribonuclease T [Hyphomicrobium methylovorum]